MYVCPVYISHPTWLRPYLASDLFDSCSDHRDQVPDLSTSICYDTQRYVKVQRSVNGAVLIALQLFQDNLLCLLFNVGFGEKIL